MPSISLLAATLVLGTSIAVGAPAPVPGAPEEPAWGKPVKGLRLGLQTTRGKAGDTRLMAVIANDGEADLLVRLGMMLANGKRQLPTAVRLTLIGADGTKRTLERKVGGVEGRVDPFVVPLAAGCRYSVLCGLGQFIDADAPGVPLAPGKYKASAAFVGEAVTGEVNGESGFRPDDLLDGYDSIRRGTGHDSGRGGETSPASRAGPSDRVTGGWITSPASARARMPEPSPSAAAPGAEPSRPS